MKDGNLREAEVYMHHRSGHRVPVFVRSAPLRDRDGGIVGSLEIFSDRSDHSRLISELEVLRKENLTDPLTGLGNRRYLELISESWFSTFRESGKSFGLLVSDIDRFKDVNDKYGHLNGDRALAMTAKTIQGAIRPMDAAVRFGGDEFIVLCSSCAVEELTKVAERIRTLMEHAWIDLGADGRLSVTLSIGGSIVSGADDLPRLIAKADERMYQCKEAGRDRCRVDV
jgi:diguanylate cyclase (GGDEF)-like protein